MTFFKPALSRLALGMTLALGLVAGAAAQTTMKISISTAQNSHQGVAIDTFAKEVEKRTGGRYKIQTFYNASLGSERESIEAVQLGTQELTFTSTGPVPNFVPDARIYHALGACSRSRRVFVEWHKHKGMVRFYGKFFRHQYPGALMWLVTLGVWLRFGLAVAYLTVRRLLARLGLKRG